MQILFNWYGERKNAILLQMVFTHFIFLTSILIYYEGYACLKFCSVLFECY